MSLNAATATPEARGEVFYSLLVEFWLTDADEPLPAPPGTQPAPTQTLQLMTTAAPLRCGALPQS